MTSLCRIAFYDKLLFIFKTPCFYVLLAACIIAGLAALRDGLDRLYTYKLQFSYYARQFGVRKSESSSLITHGRSLKSCSTTSLGNFQNLSQQRLNLRRLSYSLSQISTSRK